MSGKWNLNGTLLGTATTTIDIIGYRSPRGVRVGTQSLHGDGEYVESKGLDKGRVILQFFLLGQGTEKLDIAAQIAGIVEQNSTWTLEAPADQNIHAYRTLKKARFKTEGEINIEVVNHARVNVTIPAIFMGDPDSKPEEQQYIAEFMENEYHPTSDDAGDDGVAYVWLPAHAGHSPTAQDIVTGRFEILAGTWAYTASLPNGSTGSITAYNIGSYVQGTPLDDGDGGPVVIQRRDA